MFFWSLYSPQFFTVYLYVNKRPFTKAQTQFPYQVLLEAGVRFLLSVFFIIIRRRQDPQNVLSGRGGEEKWLFSHGKTLVKFIQIH